MSAGLLRAVWHSSGSRTSPVPPWRAQHVPVPVPIPSWGAGGDPGACPTTLAARGGLSEAPGDLGDILGAAGSTSSHSRPTSAGPTELPKPCSGTTCLTADLILINGPIV